MSSDALVVAVVAADADEQDASVVAVAAVDANDVVNANANVMAVVCVATIAIHVHCTMSVRDRVDCSDAAIDPMHHCPILQSVIH